jgi:hypothetical protein
MNTFTTDSQTEYNYNKAASDIIQMMMNYGFSTPTPFNPEDFRAMIIKCIRDNIQEKAFNVTYVG